MWEILRNEVTAIGVAGILLALATSTAGAQTITQNTSAGFSLPGVSLPTGHDEVRAADGTTCRSAVSGGGAYLDVGIIGNPDSATANDLSHYGRLVIPLGRQSKRLDCSRLYDLEVQRLQMELRLMQMGLGRGVTPPSGTAVAGEREADIEAVTENGYKSESEDLVETASAGSGNWDDEGWSTEGKQE